MILTPCKKVLCASDGPHTTRAIHMPLLRSLTAALGWRCYRHGAPKGAFLFGTYSAESSEEPFKSWWY